MLAFTEDAGRSENARRTLPRKLTFTEDIERCRACCKECWKYSSTPDAAQDAEPEMGAGPYTRRWDAAQNAKPETGCKTLHMALPVNKTLEARALTDLTPDVRP